MQLCIQNTTPRLPLTDFTGGFISYNNLILILHFNDFIVVTRLQFHV